VAKAGYFTVGDADTGTMSIVADPRTSSAAWVSCYVEEYEICEGNLAGDDLASGTTAVCGDNCSGRPVPHRSTTWGALKQAYRR
jgi:hypothetical protein